MLDSNLYFYDFGLDLEYKTILYCIYLFEF